MAPFKFSSNSRAFRVGPLEGEPQAEVGVPLACVSRENNPHSSWSFLYPRKQAGDVFKNQAMELGLQKGEPGKRGCSLTLDWETN